jgi:hypothetical protein
MGRERFEQIYRQRPAKKLEDGDHLMFQHALRCLCKMCGKLMEFECPEDIAYLEAECCGLRYRLKPRTVHVLIEDVSSRPILPKVEGSDYSDPDYDLGSQLQGELKTIETTTGGKLSQAQMDLGKPMPPPAIAGPEPQVIIYRAKGSVVGDISSAAHAADEISIPFSGLYGKSPQVPKAPIIPPQSVEIQQSSSTPSPKKPKKTKVRRCGLCREPGHNRRTCPEAGIPRTQ